MIFDGSYDQPVALTRRMMEKVKYLPALQRKDYEAIPPDLRVEMVCDQVEINSHWLSFDQDVRAVENELVNSGLFFRHPQLGLIPAHVYDLLCRWAEDET